jgi:hypothetical protein
MEPTKKVQTCRWAEPTLYLPLPAWLDAWDAPWSCKREYPARILLTTYECGTCPRWQAREQAGIGWTFSQLGL